MQRVQNRGRAGRIEHDAVEYQKVRVARDLQQVWQPLCVDVAGKGHALARMIDPIDYSRRIAVVPGDGADLEAAVLKDDMNGLPVAPGCGQVVRDEGDRRGELAQVRERAARTEQTVEEARGGREIRSGRGCLRS